MIIKPYDQWREDRIAAAAKLGKDVEAEAAEPEEKTVKCSACDGDGVIYCECGCPHCNAEIDCDECDGSGEITMDDPEKLKKNEAGLATRGEYLKELAKDLVALSEWMGKPRAHHIVEVGMAPYFMVKDGWGRGVKRLMMHDPEIPGREFEAPEGMIL